MSSTNRSNAREEHPNDYYVTPIPVIEKLLPHLEAIAPDIFSGIILDPSAGGDEERPASYPTALVNYGIPGLRIAELDIRDTPTAVQADYLETNLGYAPNLIITNPPFSLAIEFIKKALEDVAEGGYVVMLQRLNFLGSDKRKPFWDHYMPHYIFVNYQRINFRPGKKGTDSIEYAHFVWKKGDFPEFAKIKVI